LAPGVRCKPAFKTVNSAVLELRNRLFGMEQWSERKALGMPAGIQVLFEAYLYFSICKKLGRGNEIAAHFDPFHVNEELCPIEGNEYYSGQKSLLWDKTEGFCLLDNNLNLSQFPA
jgi:hypothetical protein